MTARLPDPVLVADLDALERLRSTPCATSVAAGFLDRSFSSGEYLVYPSGTEALELVRLLDESGRLRITVAIDRDAEGRDCLGRPVLVPEAVPKQGHAQILVCHSTREAELVANLHRLGIPDDRIVPVFGHPAYHALADSEETFHTLLGPIDPTIRFVIIRAERSGIVIDDAELASVFPPQETLVLNVGTPPERVGGGPYRALDLYRSLKLLRFALERIAPRVVYLQLNLHTVYLAALVRRILPNTTLIYEMWDLWRASVGDLRFEDYGRLLGMSEAMVDLNRRCEPYILNAADLLVSKRGGPVWEKECRDFNAPCLQYFARVGDREIPAGFPRQGRGMRIVFAATFQTLEILAEFDYIRPNQDHRAVFAALTADGTTTVDLYNAAHRGDAGDAMYASYLEQYRDGPIRYHRRVPAEELLAAMDGYDYGWIRATPAVPSVDCDVVIPASFSSYIAAGLPLIVHATLTYASSLVSRFDAGIVVPAGENGEQAVRRIRREADPVRHRAGARRLRAYMVEHNQRLLGELRNFCKEAVREPEGVSTEVRCPL